MLDDDIAAKVLGIELVQVGEGSATLTMTVTENMVNGHNLAHGGYLFTLADTAFAAACNSYGPVTVAAGAEVSFLTSAHVGDRLVAEARERVRYGRNGIYDVTVFRGERPDDVILEFRGRSRTIGN
jgi:acyl-CoA thioesterase